MPDLSEATPESVSAAASVLAASPIRRVTYWGFDHYGPEWDHGDYHEATMGVELLTEQGPIVACWGDAFGHFGLELHPGAASHVFGNRPDSRDFTDHAWWAPFTKGGLSVEVVWRTGHVDRPDPAPVAVLLTSPGRDQLWIANAESFDGSSPMAAGGFLHGLDNVIITASDSFAASIGLTER